MEKEPLVSVIVAVYNQESYVGKCLKSIIKQTYRNLQIIVVDDGSTDNSLKIIETFRGKDRRIVVISKKNEGVAFARRDGQNVAKGEYVVFVDSDDYLLISAIMDLVELSEKYQVDSVIGNNYIKYGPVLRERHFMPELPINKVLQGKELMEYYYISFFGKNILPVNVWGRIYRKSVIDKAMENDCLYHERCKKMGEDEYFNVMLFPYLKSLYVTDKIVSVYRWGGVTCRYNKNLPELFDFSDVRVKLLDRFNYEKGYLFLFVEYKNVLYSELLQRIQYLHQDKETLIEYIGTELSNRYLVKRMKEYYNNTDCPQSLKPLVEEDYEKMFIHALDLVKANRWKFLIKKILHRLI